MDLKSDFEGFRIKTPLASPTEIKAAVMHGVTTLYTGACAMARSRNTCFFFRLTVRVASGKGKVFWGELLKSKKTYNQWCILRFRSWPSMPKSAI